MNKLLPHIARRPLSDLDTFTDMEIKQILKESYNLPELVVSLDTTTFGYHGTAFFVLLASMIGIETKQKMELCDYETWRNTADYYSHLSYTVKENTLTVKTYATHADDLNNPDKIALLEHKFGTYSAKLSDLLQKLSGEPIKVFLNKEKQAVSAFYDKPPSGSIKRQLARCWLAIIARSLVVDKCDRNETITDYIETIVKETVKHPQQAEAILVNNLRRYAMNAIFEVSLKDEMMRIMKAARLKEVEDCKYEVDEKRNYINDYLKKITSFSKRIEELNNRITAASLMEISEEQTEELDSIEKLLNTPVIKQAMVREGKLIYQIEQPLKINDKKGWERCAKNYGDYTGAPKELMALLDEVFIKESCELYSSINMVFDITNNSISCQKSTMTQTFRTGLLKHPHLWYYNCFGGYSTPLGELISEHDLYGVIDLSLEVTTELNYVDSAVVHKFLYDLSNNTNMITFKTKEGKWFSYSDYYKNPDIIKSESTAVTDTATEVTTTEATDTDADTTTTIGEMPTNTDMWLG